MLIINSINQTTMILFSNSHPALLFHFHSIEAKKGHVTGVSRISRNSHESLSFSRTLE